MVLRPETCPEWKKRDEFSGLLVSFQRLLKLLLGGSDCSSGFGVGRRVDVEWAAFREPHRRVSLGDRDKQQVTEIQNRRQLCDDTP